MKPDYFSEDIADFVRLLHKYGVSFDEAWKEKKTEYMSIGDEDVPVYYLGLRHLLLNKKQFGRHKDRDDYEYLKNIHDE